jgi:hypothetical protein
MPATKADSVDLLEWRIAAPASVLPHARRYVGPLGEPVGSSLPSEKQTFSSAAPRSYGLQQRTDSETDSAP